MKLDFFSLLVLLGALQALFFGIFLLFAPTENRFQNRMLAFFIFILSYNGFETLNWSSGLGQYLFFFDIFPFVVIFGLGPCFYLYVRSFRKDVAIVKPWRHFVIIWVSLAWRIVYILLWILHRNKVLILSNPGAMENYTGFIEPLTVLWSAAYFIFAYREYRLLHASRTALHEEGRWLKTLIMAVAVFNVCWIVTVAEPYISGRNDEPYYYAIEVMLVIFIYFIGFAGYHRTRVIFIAQQNNNRNYFDSLDRQEVSRVAHALHQAMEKGCLYLDPELSINAAAMHLGIAPKTLSAVLNQELGKGFNEYVNGWRVEAVKYKILDPANAHLTISGIAYDCGFNSQPTFQRAFKSLTGQTPREFMQHRGSGGNMLRNPD